MAYVITEPCINVKDRSCVEVCPVDCIHPKVDEEQEETKLYINPEECIDCGACESVCPVSAIFPEAGVPDQWKTHIEMNAAYYHMSKEELVATYGFR